MSPQPRSKSQPLQAYSQAVRSGRTTSATARQPHASCLHTRRRHSLTSICDFSLASLLLQQLLLATRLAVLFYSANPTALQPAFPPERLSLLGRVDCCVMLLPANRTGDTLRRPSALSPQHLLMAGRTSVW
jgi:hypothetical protein